ncbi:T73 [Tupaiid betaherpesvirus 1]|uniref:T73 n=1 Tax=Tupaiid herpesvirus 1 (strain 1) TaxID=10397 RepID=Q91TM3_TUHV1|nr:T73 [Tupaiid betaherpesvirus 1]AAK57118.1 T73 [Tupaiid betaherpesvirus 1]
MVRAGGSRALVAVCLCGFLATLHGVSWADEAGASSPAAGVTSGPVVAARPPGSDFYEAHCHSHVYEISISSFAAVWILLNFAVFACAVGVFLKHCCYQTFATATSKGY